jgi:hypothetical protein
MLRVRDTMPGGGGGHVDHRRTGSTKQLPLQYCTSASEVRSILSEKPSEAADRPYFADVHTVGGPSRRCLRLTGRSC